MKKLLILTILFLSGCNNISNVDIGAEIKEDKFAQIVIIKEETYREGINNIGDIVAIHDSDVELTGEGYKGFNIIKIAGMTAEEVKTEIDKNKVETKIENEIEYYLKDNTWYELKEHPKYSFNTNSLTVDDKIQLQTTSNKSDIFLKIKDNLLTEIQLGAKDNIVKKAKDKNDIQIEVGSENLDVPEMILKKWDNEVNFKIRYKDPDKTRLGALFKKKLVSEDDKMKWKGDKTEIHFYSQASEKLKEDRLLGAEKEDDEFEVEVVLLKKPKTNIVSFNIETKGLKFYHQPELTQKEKDNGDIRPDNIIGSYAVYHESKQGDYTALGGKNYMAGKAFHIYRPKIVDQAGTEIWGKLNIDEKKGLLTVEIPQEFLDNAVYPVRHAAGLTFGNTGIGGTASSFGENVAKGVGNLTISTDGTVQSISIYAKTFTSVHFKGFITNSSKVILTNGVSPDVALSSSYTWKTATYSSKPKVTGANNFYPFIVGNGSIYSYRDNGVLNDQLEDETNSYNSPTNPTDASGASYKFSIYATYETPKSVFYSVSPFGTGTIETGAGNISITSGVATLTVAQTGNIGVGVCIEYNSLKCYIAPNRIGFDSGGTVELEAGTKITDATSGATGIVRAIELTSGTWAGGDAAGWIYFEKTTGTFGDNNQINRTKPTASNNIATVNGTIEGNIGNGNTEFVVKTAVGGTPANQGATAVTSVHHEYATLSAFEAGFTDGNHISNVSLVSADVIAHACCYYDHDNQTADGTKVIIDWSGTTDATRYLQIYTPTGGAESINNQRHAGKWSTTVGYRLDFDDGYDYVISCTENYIRIEGLQMHNSNANGYTFKFDSTGELYFSYNIIKGSLCTGNGNSIYLDSMGASTVKIWNNVIYNTKMSIFFDFGTAGSTFVLYNNTIVNISSDGVHVNDSADDCSLYLKNNLVFNTADDYNVSNFTTQDYDYNMGEDVAFTGDSNYVQTAQAGTTIFDDYNADDFHIKTGSDATDAGDDLSNDAHFKIWRGIDGNERGVSWDIGADEYESGDAPSAKKRQGIIFFD